MLVLTRKKSETIHIDGNIVIKVIQTGRGTVKLGIEAPADVRILRGEVAEAAEHLAESGPATPPRRIRRPFPRMGGRAEVVHQGAV